jgi:hypothetical protein
MADLGSRGHGVVAIYIAEPCRAPVVHKKGKLVLFTLPVCIAICETACFLNFHEFRSNFWRHFIVTLHCSSMTKIASTAQQQSMKKLKLLLESSKTSL